jgi:hypothetical protein
VYNGLIGGLEWDTVARVSSVFGILSNYRIYITLDSVLSFPVCLQPLTDEFSEFACMTCGDALVIVDVGSSRRSFFDTSVVEVEQYMLRCIGSRSHLGFHAHPQLTLLCDRFAVFP